MSRKSTSLPQDDSSMAREIAESGSGHYKTVSDAHRRRELAAISKSVGAALEESPDESRISLNDTEAVKAKAFAYVAACGKAGKLPTISGLAVALGHWRSSLYAHMDRNPFSATTEFLQKCRDTFADALVESALSNNVNPVVSIFVMKSIYGLREGIEIMAVPPDSPFGRPADVQALGEKYQRMLESLPSEDDE